MSFLRLRKAKQTFDVTMLLSSISYITGKTISFYLQFVKQLILLLIIAWCVLFDCMIEFINLFIHQPGLLYIEE